MKKLFSYILIFALGMATAAGAIFSPRAFAYANLRAGDHRNFPADHLSAIL